MAPNALRKSTYTPYMITPLTASVRPPQNLQRWALTNDNPPLHNRLSRFRAFQIRRCLGSGISNGYLDLHLPDDCWAHLLRDHLRDLCHAAAREDDRYRDGCAGACFYCVYSGDAVYAE